MTRQYQYSLRSLLGFVTLVAIMCSLLASFGPHGVAVAFLAVLPGAVIGGHMGQRPLGYFVGSVFAFRWTPLPLAIALVYPENHRFLVLLVVAAASAFGGWQGGNACAKLD